MYIFKNKWKNKAKYDTYSYLHPKHGVIVFAQLFLFFIVDLKWKDKNKLNNGCLIITELCCLGIVYFAVTP